MFSSVGIERKKYKMIIAIIGRRSKIYTHKLYLRHTSGASFTAYSLVVNRYMSDNILFPQVADEFFLYWFTTYGGETVTGHRASDKWARVAVLYFFFYDTHLMSRQKKNYKTILRFHTIVKLTRTLLLYTLVHYLNQT